MRLYECELTLHENLFFATREMGRLYECERFLHNYALTYALQLAIAPFFHDSSVPSYQAELEPLNGAGLYVTPARPLQVRYELTTFKYASNAYHSEMSAPTRNVPTFGRAKELGVGSRFAFGVLSQGEALRLPRWLRLGLWMSKAALYQVAVHELEEKEVQDKVLSYPLNPLDIPDVGAMVVYDLVSMRPSSLVTNVLYSGAVWEAKNNSSLRVPKGLLYRFP